MMVPTAMDDLRFVNLIRTTPMRSAPAPGQPAADRKMRTGERNQI